MIERGQTQEMEQKLLKSIFKDFELLALEYGNQPSEGMGMPNDGRTLRVEIPRELKMLEKSKQHSHADFLSGRYFGPNTGQIEVVFRNIDKQVRIQLSMPKDSSSGSINIDNVSVYKVDHTKKGGYTLDLIGNRVEDGDLLSLRDLIYRAKEILINKENILTADKISVNSELIHARRFMARGIALDAVSKRESDREKRTAEIKNPTRRKNRSRGNIS